MDETFPCPGPMPMPRLWSFEMWNLSKIGGEIKTGGGVAEYHYPSGAVRLFAFVPLSFAAGGGVQSV